MPAFNLGTSKLVGKELIDAGLISADQLAVALETRKNRGGDLGGILIKRGFVTRDQLASFIEKHYAIPSMSLADYHIDPEVVKLVPASVARRYGFMPLFRIEDSITIAVSDLMHLFMVDDICDEIKHAVQLMIAPRHEIENLIRSSYRFVDMDDAIEADVDVVRYGADGGEHAADELQELASGAKVVSDVNRIIQSAVEEGASDIHIEPLEQVTRVRNRINGTLEERLTLHRSMHLPVISRIKILSGMDIAERRVPQDGRVRLRVGGHMTDLRVSTFPTMHGEKVVIRLLGHERLYGLEDLGMTEGDRGTFEKLIQRPYGILLVTGPTGSGKTTTLYAALSRINSRDRNIVSVEDPIENEITGIAQAQVNPKAGFTFANALRSILRQDPDVIMIGEIRDRETADIAVRAAITGHLVFSTLHTNTSIGAITRMADLGVERFLVSSALLGVMAQRLVRRLCPACREPADVDVAVRDHVGIPRDVTIYRATGCEACNMSGYVGRIGLFELVALDASMRSMIAAGAGEDELRAEAARRGFTTIRDEAAARVVEGATTIEEMLRVSGEKD